MANAISVSLPDDVYEALHEELDGYGDNRSALVTAALREYLDIPEEAEA